MPTIVRETPGPAGSDPAACVTDVAREPAEAPTGPELAVLRLLAGGARLQDCADELGISRTTVQRLLRSLRAKLGTTRTTAAVTAAYKAGLITPAPLGPDIEVDVWERHLLALVGAGRTRKQLAAELGRRPDQVEYALGKLRARLGAPNRVVLLERAAALGVIPVTRGPR